jgi:hypothetical protein
MGIYIMGTPRVGMQWMQAGREGKPAHAHYAVAEHYVCRADIIHCLIRSSLV